jgi:putative addiction module killer protein
MVPSKGPPVKRIEMFVTDSGREPYLEWLTGLEERAQIRIETYLDRLALGGSNRNVRFLGDGCFELKIDIGPGYRVYFGEVGKVILLLLGGGDKSTQFRDIAKVKEYWRDYVSSRRL